QRIHHAMDNHSLRPMAPLTYDGEARIREDMVQDVTRRQLKAEAVLRLTNAQRLTLGSHWASDDHDATNHLSSEACIDFGVPMCFQQDPGLQPYYQVRQRKTGLYAEWSLDLDAWQLTLGSRRDQVDTRTGAIRSFAVNPVAKSGENGRSEHELSQHVARLSWQLADAWRTHLAWGQSQRAPDPIEVG
ncbi:TonB-dependent receptor domain-containing protein, partial [Aquabacterium sp. UBA2148]|uniref:TonB-dependent receptor domain-containing protein n=1 Tax=Aquabacterium sp. UBA2148 TaxID=1946042 RepID=UPI00257ABB21